MEPDPGRAADLAEFIGLLGELRVWAGLPSYRVLARRIGPLMRPPGIVSTSTVVDAFKVGRRRLDADLTTAIVRALGVDEKGAGRWREACLRVHRDAKSGGPSGVLRQLPRDLATFTGRAEELASLTAEGEAGTVVISALEGMAGIGKTQLALHVAHRLVRAGRYADVQLYVNLRGFDPEYEPAEPGAVLGMFLRQLDVPAAKVPADTAERAAMFRDCMHGKRVIVILDNAAGTAQIRDLLPASPTCMVLITSRRTLADLDGAVLYRLAVFTEQEAVELLSRVVGNARVAAERDAAEQIARACGYVPLAVSIVASRLRARPSWRLSDIVARLDRGVSEISSAERSLISVFDLSYQGLPQSARRAFPLLGAFPGADFTAAPVAALTGLDIAEATALLELLLDENLLEQRTHGRYEFHDLLRSYARTLAKDLPHMQIRDAIGRLMDYELRSVVSAGTAMANMDRPRALPDSYESGVEPEHFTSYEAALAWLDTEYANLMAAIDAARAHDLGEMVWNTAFAIRSYQAMRRHIDDWSNSYEKALAAARSAGDAEAEARCLSGLCCARRQAGGFEQAVEYGRLARAAYRGFGDQVGESIALNNIAIALDELHRYDESVGTYEEAIGISRAIGDDLNEAIALMNCGDTYLQMGRRDSALGAVERAQGILRAAGHSQAEMSLLDTLGDIHSEESRLAEAERAYRRCLLLATETDNIYKRLQVLPKLGTVLAGAGRREEADDAWAQAQLLHEELGDHAAAAAIAQLRQSG